MRSLVEHDASLLAWQGWHCRGGESTVSQLEPHETVCQIFRGPFKTLQQWRPLAKAASSKSTESHQREATPTRKTSNAGLDPQQAVDRC